MNTIGKKQVILLITRGLLCCTFRLGRNETKTMKPNVTRPPPIFVSHRVGNGIDSAKALKSLEHHRRKMIGTERALLHGKRDLPY